MKKLISSTLIGSTLLMSAVKVKADPDYWGYKYNKIGSIEYNDLYLIDSLTEEETFIKRFCHDDSGGWCTQNTGTETWKNPNYSLKDRNHYIDENTLIINAKIEDGGSFKQYKYSLSGTTLTRGEETSASPTEETLGTKTYWHEAYTSENNLNGYGSRDGNATTQDNGNKNANYGTTSITQKKISLGEGTNEIDISSEGLKVGGNSLITQQSNGEIHIGKNSLITTAEDKNGLQPLYAKDAAGNRIPINIDGSKLLINGRDVEQSINNVGALSAALTGLPTVPTDSPIACGVGSGTHGGNIAFAGGCASKVNEKLSFNAAASFVPGQDYQGNTEDAISARAGFVWKLGKSTKSTLISMKARAKMEEKINSLEKNNKKIISQNEDLKQKNQSIISQNEDLKQKNQSIISQNKSLLARLEKLEKIALRETNTRNLATIKLP